MSAKTFEVVMCLVLWTAVLDVCFTFNLTILHTNDVHSHIEQFNAYGRECWEKEAQKGECFGGVARRMTKVKEIWSQRPNVLLLDGGNRFVGTHWYTEFKGLADSFFMNKFPYDAMCLGNHEFDAGVDSLVAFLDNLTVPVVSANTDVTKEPRLQGLFTKSITKSVGGENIGIIGYTSAETGTISNAGPTITFHGVVESVQAEVDALKQQGVNKIIALGHAGFSMDQTIASNVDGVDIVVGGQRDIFLYTGDPPSNEEAKGLYPTVITNPSGGNTLVVLDFSWGKYLGELNVVFDANGEVESYSGNPILLNSSVAEDPDTKALVDAWAEKLSSLRSEVVGETLVTFDGERANCRLKECNLGNLITDAIIDYHSQFPHPNTSWAPASVAIWNSGGIRASVAVGNITVGNVLEVMPFGDEVDLITVKGSTILKVLERSVEDWNPEFPWGHFLQMSGLHVTYDLTKPALSRVVRVDVRCLECLVPSYSPLDKDHVYSMLVSTFLIDGRDGYSMLTDEKITQEMFSSLDSYVLRVYIQKHSPVYPEVEGRISFYTDMNGGTSGATTLPVTTINSGFLLALGLVISMLHCHL